MKRGNGGSIGAAPPPPAGPVTKSVGRSRHVARQRRAGKPAQGQRSAALGKPPIIPIRPARAGAFSSVPKVMLIKCHLVALQQWATCALAGRKRRIGAGFPRAALRLPWAGLLRAFSAGAMGSRGITRMSKLQSVPNSNGPGLVPRCEAHSTVPSGQQTWSMSGSEAARGWMTENPCKVQALPSHSRIPLCPPARVQTRLFCFLTSMRPVLVSKFTQCIE